VPRAHAVGQHCFDVFQANNVRELRNIVERAVVLSRGTVIEPEYLPPELLNADRAKEVRGKAAALGPLSESEAATILHALRQTSGHRGKAAAFLGIDTSTLWRKMKKHQISFP
jgi:DNA-binding NtrC family response regulator